MTSNSEGGKETPTTHAGKLERTEHPRRTRLGKRSKHRKREREREHKSEQQQNDSGNASGGSRTDTTGHQQYKRKSKRFSITDTTNGNTPKHIRNVTETVTSHTTTTANVTTTTANTTLGAEMAMAIALAALQQNSTQAPQTPQTTMTLPNLETILAAWGRGTTPADAESEALPTHRTQSTRSPSNEEGSIGTQFSTPQHHPHQQYTSHQTLQYSLHRQRQRMHLTTGPMLPTVYPSITKSSRKFCNSEGIHSYTVCKCGSGRNKKQCILCGAIVTHPVSRHYKKKHPNYVFDNNHQHYPKPYYFYTERARLKCPKELRPPRESENTVMGYSQEFVGYK
ncbi:unnamed protein product [Diatraea saccharalis]|uniref:Uncharacterized protein n=1 Tax=Diatraea saccharalis TaxID=40085 RepID=A0A9N9QYE1_9NEOP|nr:unnamed protein product [Diatraea saccharalis]